MIVFRLCSFSLVKHVLLDQDGLESDLLQLTCRGTIIITPMSISLVENFGVTITKHFDNPALTFAGIQITCVILETRTERLLIVTNTVTYFNSFFHPRNL